MNKLSHKQRNVFFRALLMIMAFATGTAVAQTPDPPVSLAPTNIGMQTFTANWNASATATEYRLTVFVTYPLGSGGGPPLIIFDVGNVLQKDVGVITAGCQIDYKVTALISGSNESAFSNDQAFYLLPGLIPFGYPVPCTYEIGQTYFNSPYNLTPYDGATSSLTFVALDSLFTQPISGSPFEALVGGPPAIVTPLDPATTYWVRFAKKNPAGLSPYSVPAFTVTTLPKTPVLGSSATTTNSISLSWPALATATGYSLDLSKDNFTNYVVGYSDLTLNGVTTYTITGLDPLTTYQARIRAKGVCGYTPNSNVVAISTLAIEPIAQPTALVFSNVASNGLTASFSNATGSPDGYLVLYRSTSSPTESPVDGMGYTAGDVLGTSTVGYFGASNTLTLTGLAAETSYFFDIFSYNGASGYNYLSTSPLQGSVSTLSLEPANQPTGIGFSTITDTGLTISFTGAPGSKGYLVLSKVGSAPTEIPADGTTYLAGGSLGTSKIVYFNVNTTVSDAGLSAGMVYFYSIFSFNGNTGTYNFLTSSPLQGSQGTLPSAPVLTAPTAITFSGFDVAWTSVTSATNYELDVSSDNFTTFVSGYSAKLVGNVTTVTVSGLLAGATYKVRLRAINPVGASVNSNTQTAIINSTSLLTMGAITYTSRQDNSTTQTLNISVTGGQAPYTVEFKQKGILATDFSSTVLTATTPGNYSFDITPAMLDKLGVAFEADVTDVVGAKDKKTGEIYLSFAESQSPTLPFEKFGGTDDTWNLFSIPYDLDNKSISSIFIGYNPDRYEYDWKIVRYRTASNDYVNFNTGQVKLGEAYWFNAKENLPLKIGAGQISAQIPFVLNLSKGWNLVGNPYAVSISWNKVLADNSTVTGVEGLQVFAGSKQSAGDVIAPFKGGFAWSDADTQLKIDPTTAASGRSSARKLKIESHDPDETAWMIPLRLVADGIDSEMGGFGMHPQASEQKDRYDAMAVPRFVLYNDLVSEHPGYFYPWFSTDVVPAQSTYTWSFSLASNVVKELSQLTWDQGALQDKHSKLYLFDKSAGVLVDMSQRGSYPVNLTRGAFQFNIYYSANGEPFIPDELMLGEAWPNPATAFVNIPVALPGVSQEIDLSVYDMTGRQVATIAKGKFAAGVYTFTWDFSSERPVSGLFIYRITFPDSNHPSSQKKLILR